MYFNFDDNHPDTPRIPQPLSRREVVLIAVNIHAIVLIAILLGPRLPFVREMMEQRQKAIDEQAARRARTQKRAGARAGAIRLRPAEARYDDAQGVAAGGFVRPRSPGADRRACANGRPIRCRSRAAIRPSASRRRRRTRRRSRRCRAAAERRREQPARAPLRRARGARTSARHDATEPTRAVPRSA